MDRIRRITADDVFHGLMLCTIPNRVPMYHFVWLYNALITLAKLYTRTRFGIRGFFSSLSSSRAHSWIGHSRKWIPSYLPNRAFVQQAIRHITRKITIPWSIPRASSVEEISTNAEAA
jgi:hypothetical protein